MIEPRVYRAAFVPALLAVVLAMFSLESRPRPLPQGLAADVLFDGELARDSAARIAGRSPDRRPGSIGNRRTAALAQARLERLGFRVGVDRFVEDGRDLVNVIASRAGRSRRQIVIVANRDAAGVPDATGSASDTAALLELARVFQGRPSRKTLVLASLDGSTLGHVGASRLADTLGDPSQVDAVLAVSDLGAPERKGSPIVAWSGDATRAGIGLERTVAGSLREELEIAPDAPRVAGQLARLALPLGIGSQGVFLERGFDSVRISGSGELPPEGSRSAEEIDEDRLGGLGRTTLRTVTALDQGRPPERGPRSYVIAVSQVMPGWVISLLALALLLPALVASVDAFARARRRREPVGRWLRLLGVTTLPFVAALALAQLLAFAGATPHPPSAAVPPAYNELDAGAVAVLALLTVVTGSLWLGLRFLVVRGDPVLADRSSPGLASAAALAMGVGVLVLWAVNAFAALVLVPAAHLWLLATLTDPRPPRRGRLLLVAAGLVPPVAVGLYYLLVLDMDPLTGAWYLVLLVTGHSVGILTALIGCLVLGVLGAVVASARAGGDREAPDEPPRERIYGPGAHAGPGSLGGTGSALRR